jgi:GxxExxY protein
MDRGLVWKEESYRIIGACFAVYNELGSGFLEAVYQECLALELTELGMPFQQNPRLRLTYRGKPLRQVYEPDFLFFGKILIEIKAVSRIADEHRAQVINYLRASGLKLGFLVNFVSHPDLWYQRFVNQIPASYSRDPRDS